MPAAAPIPVAAQPSSSPSPQLTAEQPSATNTPLPAPSPTVTHTLTPVCTPSSPVTATRPAATQTAQATTIPHTVLFHPDGGLYAGDQVSMEVFLPQEDKTRISASQVLVMGPDGSRLGAAGFGVYGLGQRVEAMLVWNWDTGGLSAGEYPLTFTIEPLVQVWTETVTLLPQAELPWPEPDAHWASAASRCCRLYYITGTAAERDLADLMRQADEQASHAVQAMGVEFTAPITITLLSRVLGHGGFAGQEIDISYLDRNYAGSDFGQVLHHEMIHILDGRLGGEYRPSLFVEGLAVYKSGGHFKPEALMSRAAALLPEENGLGWYIPLAELADKFYFAQHETGYLEGAALIEYMVNTWGWEAFSSFYRDIRPPDDNSQATAIDAALEKHFQMSLNELEAEFKAALARIPVTSALRDDMRLTVEYFDTVRRYQQILDPSAYFPSAWLVDTEMMRARGIVADYLRHPASLENSSLEIMLTSAYADLRLGQYAQVDQRLQAINAVLEAVQRGDERPFDVDAQAADYYAIVRAVDKVGYEAQRVELDENSAHTWAVADSAELVELTMERSEAGWEIVAYELNWYWDGKARSDLLGQGIASGFARGQGVSGIRRAY